MGAQNYQAPRSITFIVQENQGCGKRGILKYLISLQTLYQKSIASIMNLKMKKSF